MKGGGVQADPRVTIDDLRARYPSLAVDWERILAAQYAAALVAPRTTVDVGAHEGFHVAHMLESGASVVAFEPIPELAEKLRNRFANKPVVVHEVALSNRIDSGSFTIERAAVGESGLNIRADRLLSETLVKIAVDIRRLDDYALSDVDYIKIDTEGGDVDVLSGSTSTIDFCRPLVSIEYGWAGYSSYGLERRSLLDWATSHRYLVCDLFGSSFDAEAYDYCVDRYYWDFLLVPSEREQLFNRLKHNGSAILSDIGDFLVGS